jgi:hypothetical protein
VLVTFSEAVERARRASWITRWLLRRVPSLALTVEDFNVALQAAIAKMEQQGKDLDAAIRAHLTAAGPPAPPPPTGIPVLPTVELPDPPDEQETPSSSSAGEDTVERAPAADVGESVDDGASTRSAAAA